MDTNGHQFPEKEATTDGTDNTDCWRAALPCPTVASAEADAPLFFCPRITRIDAKIGKNAYLSARRTSTTITLFTASSSQYVIA